MPPPTALIAEDEPLLRAQLKSRLGQAWPELVIVGEAETGSEAVMIAERERPDVAFLDIQMPVMTGIEAGRLLVGRCQLVFITAFDQHAIAAFQHGAVDYLLKPATTERLETTVARLKERLRGADANTAVLEETLKGLAAHMGLGPRHLRWIKASVGSQLRLIDTGDVLYFHAQDKYTKVVTTEGEAYIRKTIKELEGELDPDVFWQVHRATIVNARAIAGVTRDARDQPMIRLRGREELLAVSRAYAHLFRQM
jgi:DNA-binding LytR/AlgR family response regulator